MIISIDDDAISFFVDPHDGLIGNISLVASRDVPVNNNIPACIRDTTDIYVFVNKEVKHSFATRYLRNIQKISRVAKNVRLWMGEKQPLRVSSAACVLSNNSCQYIGNILLLKQFDSLLPCTPN